MPSLAPQTRPSARLLLLFIDNQAHAKKIVAAGTKGDQSVLHGIFNSGLPASEKTTNRIYQEALVLVGAGSETAGRALETLFYHILADLASKQSFLRDSRAL